MKTFSLIFAIIAALFTIQNAVAQSKIDVPVNSKIEQKPKLVYDADLAKRLGGDQRGMRKYVLAILKTGPADITDKEERARLFKGHFELINRLAKERKLSVAGPFTDGGEYRGLYVFNVETIEEAQKLTESDPSIKEGIFRVEFIKWYGSAALMEVNNIHNRISKQD